MHLSKISQAQDYSEYQYHLLRNALDALRDGRKRPASGVPARSAGQRREGILCFS